jgi:cytochrome c oxidase assembly protein subunit 15
MSIMLVVGVLAQVMIGAIVVRTGLNPISNIAHFLVSIFLMSVAYMLVRHARIFRLTENAAPRGEPRLKDKFAISLVRLMVVATGLAVLTGTVVTGSGPHAGDEDAIRLGFGVTRVVRIHSATVWLAMFASLVLAVLIRRRRNLTEILQRSVSRFLFVLVVQGGIGYTQYFLGVPVILVALHVAISVAVWLCAVDVYWNSRLSTQQPNVID